MCDPRGKAGGIGTGAGTCNPHGQAAATCRVGSNMGGGKRCGGGTHTMDMGGHDGMGGQAHVVD